MARTEVRGGQIKDTSVQRADLDTTTSGQAVTTRIIAGTNINIGSTGADTGTGDVTINMSAVLTGVYGGTGFGTTAVGDLLQGTTGNAWAKLASVADGSFLRSGGVTTASTWSTVKLPTTMSALGLWVANSANTTVNLTAAAGQSIRVNAGGTAWEAYTPGVAVTDGDKGDITVSSTGTVWTIDSDISKAWLGDHTFQKNAAIVELGFFRNQVVADNTQIVNLKFQGLSDTSAAAQYGALGIWVLDDVNTAHDGYMTFSVASAGSLTERMRLLNTGQLRLPAYTASGSFSGTPVGYLQFDSSGNIITAAVPSGGTIGGSITDNQIAVGAATSNNIEGSANFTWDGTTMSIRDGAATRTLNLTNTGSLHISRTKLALGSSVFTISGATGISGDINGEALELYGGSAYSVGNGNGGEVRLTPGAPNGSGSWGNVFINMPDTTSRAQVYMNAGATNDVKFPFQLWGAATSPALGIGVGMEFRVMTASGPTNSEVGATISAVTTNVGSGNEAFDLVFKTMSGGATAADRMILRDAEMVVPTNIRSFSGNININPITTGTLSLSTTNTGSVLIGNNTGSIGLYGSAVNLVNAPATTITFSTANILVRDSSNELRKIAASGGGTDNFLRADGTWAAPGGGIGGSITDNQIAVGAATSNNIEGSSALTFDGSTLITTGTVQAVNFRDSNASYNVNLGSGGTEGRGIVAGYSGSSYSSIGYNIRHTGTTGQWIAPSTDYASMWLFNAGGVELHSWGGGTAGRTLTSNSLFSVNASGAVNFNAAQWHTSGGQNRFYFLASSHTYFGTGGSYIWRNSADADLMTLTTTGLGIGKLASYRLDVNGDIRAETDIYITVVGTGQGLWADDGAGSTIFSISRQPSNEVRFQGFGDDMTFYTGSSSGTERVLINTDGIRHTATGNSILRLRGGNYGTSYNTSLRSMTGATGILQFGNNGANYILAGNTAAGGSLIFKTNVSDETTGTGVEAMRLDSAGKVGIGMAPSYKLDVYGRARMAYNSSDGSSGIWYEGTTTTDWFVGLQNNTTFGWWYGSWKLLMNSNGQITLGDGGTPATHIGLHINLNASSQSSYIRMANTGSYEVGTIFDRSGTGAVTWHQYLKASTSDTNLYFYGAGADRFSFTTGGVGTATDWATSSDARLKKNISPWNDGLNLVRAISKLAREYDVISTGKHEIGFVAQEIQNVAPQYVIDGDMLAVNYNKMVVPLYSAFGQLADNVETEVEKLNKRVTDLENKLKQYGISS